VVPKGDLKSQRIVPNFPRDLLGKTLRRAPEKIDSWILPRACEYASRTMPAMVFACSSKCLQTTFFITFGFLLASFLAAGAPKSRPASAKEAAQKTRKNGLCVEPGVARKWAPKGRWGNDPGLFFSLKKTFCPSRTTI
jgi:hypothetical protein